MEGYLKADSNGEFNGESCEIGKKLEFSKGVYLESKMSIIYGPHMYFKVRCEDGVSTSDERIITGKKLTILDILHGYYINDNSELYFKKGMLHRLDAPANIFRDDQWWWLNGRMHREGSPASNDGSVTEWYINDRYFLCENKNDEKNYHINGRRHRSLGPYNNSNDYFYCINDFLHREDGFAKTYHRCGYWLSGAEIQSKDQLMLI